LIKRFGLSKEVRLFYQFLQLVYDGLLSKDEEKRQEDEEDNEEWREGKKEKVAIITTPMQYHV
jgi:hypothetical protein